MRYKSWLVQAALIGLSLVTCSSEAANRLPEVFVVRSQTPDESNVLRFTCKHVENGDLLCDVSEISVSYYEWSGTASGLRESKRCHVTSGVWKSQHYAASGLGRWQRSEVGVCGAVVQTEIVVNNGTVSMRDITISNPSAQSKDANCRVWGKPGTTKTYERTTTLAVTPRECSSVVIDP